MRSSGGIEKKVTVQTGHPTPPQIDSWVPLGPPGSRSRRFSALMRRVIPGVAGLAPCGLWAEGCLLHYGFLNRVLKAWQEGAILTVLVVGGAGYIGSHAARVLRRQGFEVLLYDNLSTGHAALANGFELVVGDIAETGKLAGAMKRSQAVMHFAASAYVG